MGEVSALRQKTGCEEHANSWKETYKEDKVERREADGEILAELSEEGC